MPALTQAQASDYRLQRLDRAYDGRGLDNNVANVSLDLHPSLVALKPLARAPLTIAHGTAPQAGPVAGRQWFGPHAYFSGA